MAEARQQTQREPLVLLPMALVLVRQEQPRPTARSHLIRPQPATQLPVAASVAAQAAPLMEQTVQERVQVAGLVERKEFAPSGKL